MKRHETIFDSNKVFNTDWLVKNSTKIHYFGLGFIQVKINDSQRIHFYSNKLPVTVGMEEIHNHRYNFVSAIMKGTIFNTIYDIEFDEKGSHILSEESCNPDNPLESPLTIVKTDWFGKFEYKADDNYYMDHHTFHTVESIDAITVLTRSGYKKETAQVIRPKNQDLICPFSVNISQSELIDHLKEIIER